MKIKGLIDEDIANYKKTSMFIIFPTCTFKCDKENGNQICQNCDLAYAESIDMSKEEICDRYINNELTSAIVLGGLEPFDSEMDLLSFVDCLRNRYYCNDDIVIYTGYTEEELIQGYRDIPNNNESLHINLFNNLLKYDNIIIKYGRFIPNEKSHYDEVLGVLLSSPNQYAKLYKHEDICKSE